MKARQQRMRQEIPLLRKIAEVMLAMGADQQPALARSIREQLVAKRYFRTKEAAPFAGILRIKIWNTDRYFRSGDYPGEYSLRRAGVAFVSASAAAPIPRWDPTELLGEHAVQMKRSPVPGVDPQDFFANGTFRSEVMDQRARTVQASKHQWFATGDSRTRLRIGLGRAMQNEGVSSRSCGFLFGQQVQMFVNGYQRTFAPSALAVACEILSVSVEARVLVGKSTDSVRLLAFETELSGRSDTPAVRAALMRLRKAADEYRRRLAAESAAVLLSPMRRD